VHLASLENNVNKILELSWHMMQTLLFFGAVSSESTVVQTALSLAQESAQAREDTIFLGKNMQLIIGHQT
jgi:hypothetical protein